LDTALSEPRFEGNVGSNPKKWPEGLQEFLSKIETFDNLAFFSEPMELKNEFFIHSQEYLLSVC
jgi:hypothetical protein